MPPRPNQTNRTPHIPSYRLHKASGQAVVTLDGRDIYLGAHGSPESHKRYHDEIARWQVLVRLPAYSPASATPRGRELCVNELFLRFWQHAQQHYRKDGQPTSEAEHIRISVRELLALYGTTPVDSFGPLALKATRQAMIDRDLSRGVVNQRIGRIKRMVKWGVANELVAPATLQALQAVTGLQRGRTVARGMPPVLPASQELIDAVLPLLSTPVAAMVRLQILTGMRPGEVTILRPCDVERTSRVWIYRPASHKTAHHGRERQIFIGPKAQGVLSPFLLRPSHTHCFSPAEAMAQCRQERKSARITPLVCGNRAGTNRKIHPKKQPGTHYDTHSYRRAITSACQKRFPAPADLHGEALKQWHKDHRFHPHQLRHNAATTLAKAFGIEAAQTVLGHASLAVTQVYAERDFEKAAAIMHQVG